MNISKSIQTVNNVDDYNGKFQKFEDEIDFHVDKVIKSIYQTADILTIHHKEILQLDKQTDSIYQKLNSEKEMINNSIDKFNNTNMEKEFWKWRERLKQKNETNVSFTKEALKLKSNYQQKM
ncbi:Hypothetical protein CINCED_3A024763 [Cinara cedri]|uniref:Uncharacterized protein n=1 Tax=Cinara cedri TaxID=506608 RepID=A0A5E4N7T6_9HEMI|nr:Hypothetical protein CINCED_3A024763 [Cinara cedri]